MDTFENMTLIMGRQLSTRPGRSPTRADAAERRAREDGAAPARAEGRAREHSLHAVYAPALDDVVVLGEN